MNDSERYYIDGYEAFPVYGLEHPGHPEAEPLPLTAADIADFFRVRAEWRSWQARLGDIAEGLYQQSIKRNG